MITARDKLQLGLDAIGESWPEIETFGITEAELDEDVDGLESGTPVAWTRSRVYFIATHVEGLGNILLDAPRSPGDFFPCWEILGSPRYPDPEIWP